MPNIGIILSGCGVFDGSEVHEAVITLLALDLAGATYQCMAPNKQFDVIDHVTKKPTGEKRGVLTEAARIARGNIVDLAGVKGSQFDGFVLPGGFGAAKNLCDFASAGAAATPDAQVKRVLTEAHAAGKPIGFICIAPAVAAAVFGKSLHPTLTIGKDAGTAQALEKMGAKHAGCAVDAFTIDAANKIISTPAYMDAKSIKEAHAGISRLVTELVKMSK
jgi:enhancing lycopene biosynthesis protein 2